MEIIYVNAKKNFDRIVIYFPKYRGGDGGPPSWSSTNDWIDELSRNLYSVDDNQDDGKSWEGTMVVEDYHLLNHTFRENGYLFGRKEISQEQIDIDKTRAFLCDITW